MVANNELLEKESTVRKTLVENEGCDYKIPQDLRHIQSGILKQQQQQKGKAFEGS